MSQSGLALEHRLLLFLGLISIFCEVFAAVFHIHALFNCRLFFSVPVPLPAQSCRRPLLQLRNNPQEPRPRLRLATKTYRLKGTPIHITRAFYLHKQSRPFTKVGRQRIMQPLPLALPPPSPLRPRLDDGTLPSLIQS